jgi:hypothetical protein
MFFYINYKAGGYWKQKGEYLIISIGWVFNSSHSFQMFIPLLRTALFVCLFKNKGHACKLCV